MELLSNYHLNYSLYYKTIEHQLRNYMRELLNKLKLILISWPLVNL